jgi:hypothetical protein
MLELICSDDNLEIRKNGLINLEINEFNKKEIVFRLRDKDCEIP